MSRPNTVNRLSPMSIVVSLNYYNFTAYNMMDKIVYTEVGTGCSVGFRLLHRHNQQNLV